jgi:hypothetical protein
VEEQALSANPRLAANSAAAFFQVSLMVCMASLSDWVQWRGDLLHPIGNELGRRGSPRSRTAIPSIA